MRHDWLGGLALGVVVLWTGSASAAISPPVSRPPEGLRDTTAAARELVEMSGLGTQLDALADQIRLELGRQYAGASRPEREAIEAITARHFRGPVLRAHAEDLLASRLIPGALGELRDWFRSPLGRRVVGLEGWVAHPEREQDMLRFIAALGDRGPSAPRLGLVQRLDVAARTTETSFEVTAAIVRSLARAADRSGPASERPPGTAVDRQLRESRAAALERMRPVSLITLLYTYSALSDEELGRLVAFVESRAGQWFATTAAAVIVGAVTAAAEQYAPEVADVVSGGWRLRPLEGIIER